MTEWVDDSSADIAVFLNDLEFLWVEFSRLVQNSIRDADFSNIMELGSLFNEVDCCLSWKSGGS